jgi:glycosyltransferase involved in cell wall biosynthesis
VHGIEIAAERAVVFPYLRLQPELRFRLWRDVLESVHGIGYFSDAERRLMRGYVGLAPRHDEVVGIGIDPPPMQSYPRHQQDPADVIVDEDEVSGDGVAALTDDYLTQRGVPFRRRHRLYGSFALYGGRVEPDNGCEEMLEYFDSYAAADPEAMLVLMGVKMMKLPEEGYIRSAGVLPDRERMVAYEAADVTLAPSPDDLLSQPVLESLAVGTPVLVNAANQSAVEHCRRGGAGLYYRNREEFAEALRMIMSNSSLRARLGEGGKNYVRQHYRWDGVLGRFDRLIARVRKAS